MQARPTGLTVRSHNLSADLFGLAAGILLGLNFRAMRRSGISHSDSPRF
jgi:hypothetical protein